MPRVPELKGQVVRVVFQRPPAADAKPPASGKKSPPPRPADRVQRLELAAKPSERITLDAPVLTALGGEREKRRPVALAAIPARMHHAVLAIDDRRFSEPPGFDPIGMVGAVIANVRRKHAYTPVPSTIT